MIEISGSLVLLLVILAAGLYMTWTIGANDVANAIGASVGSGALSLRNAVMLAAVFEFCGAYFFGSHVSETIEEGIVDSSFFALEPMVLVYGMLSVLLGAGLWIQAATYWGLPVSTTHTIVGALVGFGWSVGGLEAVYWKNVLSIFGSWLATPLAGGMASYAIFSLLRRKIFYAKDPIRATKRLVPLIVFSYATIFSLVLLLKRFDSGLPLLLLSLGLAAGAGGLSAYLVRRLKPQPDLIDEAYSYKPDVLYRLQKAKKHLEKAEEETGGDLHFQLRQLIDEVDAVSYGVQEHKEQAVSMSDTETIERTFGKLQILSAILIAFSHGANDVANAIGPLTVATSVLLKGTPHSNAALSSWLLALGGLGIVLGLATWGWRVIQTIGKKITELTPTRGFSAEFGAAATILIASRLGFPVSATHTLVGSILGVGFARGIEALNLNTMRDIVISWIVTVPSGALLAAALYQIVIRFA